MGLENIEDEQDFIDVEHIRSCFESIKTIPNPTQKGSKQYQSLEN